MKKRFRKTALVLALALCAAAKGALAAGTLHMDGVPLGEGWHLPAGASAPVAGAPAQDAQGYAWFHEGVLTLSHFKGESLRADGLNLTIRLVGDNALANASGSALSAQNSRLIVEGGGASLALSASLENEEAVALDGGSLLIRGGAYALSALDDCIEAGGGLTIENAQMTLENASLYDEEGMDVEAGGSVVIRGSHITMDVPQDGIRTDGGDVLIEDSTLRIRSRMGDGICSFGGLTVRGSRLTVDANRRGLMSMGAMSLRGSALAVTARHADGLAVSAAGGLDAPGMPVIADVPDPFLQMRVDSVGEGGVPFRSLHFAPQTDLRPPATGDPTPLALFAALMAISLTGLLWLRRGEG